MARIRGGPSRNRSLTSRNYSMPSRVCSSNCATAIMATPTGQRDSPTHVTNVCNGYVSTCLSVVPCAGVCGYAVLSGMRQVAEKQLCRNIRPAADFRICHKRSSASFRILVRVEISATAGQAIKNNRLGHNRTDYCFHNCEYVDYYSRLPQPVRT